MKGLGETSPEQIFLGKKNAAKATQANEQKPWINNNNKKPLR